MIITYATIVLILKCQSQKTFSAVYHHQSYHCLYVCQMCIYVYRFLAVLVFSATMVLLRPLGAIFMSHQFHTNTWVLIVSFCSQRPLVRQIVSEPEYLETSTPPKKTNGSHLKRCHSTKGKDRIPSINFQVRAFTFLEYIFVSEIISGPSLREEIVFPCFFGEKTHVLLSRIPLL